MTDPLSLSIIEAPGIIDVADLTTTAIAVRGNVTVPARRTRPVWLPPLAGFVFVDPSGGVFTADTFGQPTKVGSLVEAVFGRSILARFAHTDYVGLRFDDSLPAILAPCIEDTAGVDLCLDRASTLLAKGQRLYLARENLAHAVQRALERIGSPRRGDPEGLTLHKIFGKPC